MACCLAAAVLWQRQFMREVRYFNGFKMMRSNNAVMAAAELRRAWEAHPREVNSNYEMGNAYVRAGEEQKALWAYGEALKSNAGYDEIYFNMAIVLKRQGRAKEALDALKVSSLINPMNAVTWQALAEIYLNSPDRSAVAAEAAGLFEEAVRAFPRDPMMWNTLGYFRTLLRDYSGARDAYAKGLKIDPASRMLAENLAGVVRQMGLKKDPALDWYNAYADLAPRADTGPDVPAMMRKADALVAMDPAAPKALMLRAKLFFREGKLAAARADLQAALRVTPDDNAARYGLAVVFEKEGDVPAAIAQWRRFLETEPGNAAVAARLAALQAGR
jgi:Flp pilus assembly protein TadD